MNNNHNTGEINIDLKQARVVKNDAVLNQYYKNLSAKPQRKENGNMKEKVVEINNIDEELNISPRDNIMIFNSKVLADDYARNNPLAYQGQNVCVMENENPVLYALKSEESGFRLLRVPLKETKIDTAIIGIGQCGGNIAHRATGKGFLTCAVNTSKEDLAGCNTDLKYEFKNAGGSGKERARSKNIFASNLDDFNTFFNASFFGIKNIIIVASAAGGTGGGSAPMCARFLKDNYPDKNIFLIVVLGSIYEDIKSQENMLTVLEEINKCEVNYLVFDNHRIESSNSNEVYNKIDDDIIEAAEFISRQYFIESDVSNIDIADMQKLYLENKRMIIVSGKFDTKVSNKVDPNQQIIDAIKNSSQVQEISNPMSYAVFISSKQDEKSTMAKLDKEFRLLVDEFGEPYEIYKHYQNGPDYAPDFVVCITGLNDCVDRYSVINERLAEFNERSFFSKKFTDINKVTINARDKVGVVLPDEIEKKSTEVNRSSLDLFM